MSYSEFLALVNFSAHQSGKVGSSTLREETDAVIDRIRRSLDDSLGNSASSARRIKETFADIDRNGNNLIDKNELAKALRILRVDATSREVDNIFDRFDVDGKGELDYRDFLKVIGFQSTSATPRATESKY